MPSFVNAPAALSLALALWLGLCLYISLLDRTPRAYVFLLAGYTARIIGFPSVQLPGGDGSQAPRPEGRGTAPF